MLVAPLAVASFLLAHSFLAFLERAYSMAINIFASAADTKRNPFAAPKDPYSSLSPFSTLRQDSVFALPLNCNLLPFGWLLLPRQTAIRTAVARINGWQLKQITLIVITPPLSTSPLPPSPLISPPFTFRFVVSLWLIRKLCCILCARHCSAVFYRVDSTCLAERQLQFGLYSLHSYYIKTLKTPKTHIEIWRNPLFLSLCFWCSEW